jgi:hypothetical protein
MNHQELFITAAIAASVALSAPLVNAGQYNSPDARALAAAQEGPTALRHFVDRTRMIYALNFGDFYKPGDEPADADGSADDSADDDGQSTQGEAPESPAAAAERHRKELEEFREQIYRDMLRE